MGQFSEERRVAHPPDLLHRVVTDVAAYPLFLPWCKSAQEVPAPAGVEAPSGSAFWQLQVGWGSFRGSYVSRVTATPYAEGGGVVVAQAVAGAVKQLDSSWQIRPAPRAEGEEATSLVAFSVAFSFRGVVMERVAEAAFAVVAARLAGAFATRAEQLRLVKALE